MSTALVTGLSGIAAKPVANLRTPVVSDDHVVSGRACSLEHLQCVVDQRADVIGAVRRNRRR